MQKCDFAAALVLFLLAVVLPIYPQQSKISSDRAPTLSAAERTAVIDPLIEKVNARYVYPEVAQRMTAAIRAHEARHEYDNIVSGEEFARILTADLRAISNDGHLGVDYSAIPTQEKAAEEPSAEEIAKFRETGARNNYGFRRVERLDGNVALLQLDSFYPAEWIKETALGAMAFMANADAVIIDLRRNHGFAPDGVLLIESYFFKDETHITDQIDRDAGKTHQYWTMPAVPGSNLAGKDLYVLTSHDTFSAGEDFAYNMQAPGRAKIVGEKTGGGAHGTRPYRLSAHFTASIPFSYSKNPVTDTDWEGVGIKPDVSVPADQAVLSAHILALRTILKRTAGEPERESALQHLIAEKEQELAAPKK